MNYMFSHQFVLLLLVSFVLLSSGQLHNQKHTKHIKQSKQQKQHNKEQQNQSNSSQLITSYLPENSPPDFFLIGATKCGTTSLHQLLLTHPEMCGGTAKEIHFFDRPQEYSQGVSHYMRNFHHPECHMRGRHFIDSTPNYLDHEETPQRIASTYSPSDLKKKRFVIVLRDPVYRSYSWYNHMMKHCVASMHNYLASAAARHTTMPSTGWNTTLLCSDSRHCEDVQCVQRASHAKLGSEVQSLATFSDYYTSGALDTSKGHYMEQIRRWLDIVPRSQIFILNLATLLSNTSDSMNRITDFLGLKTHFNSGITLPHDNTATVVTDFPCEVRTAQ